MSRPSRLTESEIAARLATLPQWEHVGATIRRVFKFGGFPDAVRFIDTLVAPAEALNHHPDVDLRYNRVVVTLSTHDQGGLTAFDFELAKQIDALE